MELDAALRGPMMHSISGIQSHAYAQPPKTEFKHTHMQMQRVQFGQQFPLVSSVNISSELKILGGR